MVGVTNINCNFFLLFPILDELTDVKMMNVGLMDHIDLLQRCKGVSGVAEGPI